MLPTEYFRRNFMVTFEDDDIGVQTREQIGVKNLLGATTTPTTTRSGPTAARSSTRSWPRPRRRGRGDGLGQRPKALQHQPRRPPRLRPATASPTLAALPATAVLEAWCAHGPSLGLAMDRLAQPSIREQPAGIRSLGCQAGVPQPTEQPPFGSATRRNGSRLTDACAPVGGPGLASRVRLSYLLRRQEAS